MAVMKNKKIVIALVVGLLAAVAGMITAGAFFTSSDDVSNKFTVADPKVTVVENPENGPYVWGSDTKQVQLRNDSENMDGYVRCTVFPVIINADGKIENLGTSGFSEPVENSVYYGDVELILHDNWSENWIYSGGYFYYKYKLTTGSETSLLLNGVDLKDGADKTKYKDLTVNIEVSADIIQPEAIAKDNAWEYVTIKSNGLLALKEGKYE